MTTCIGALVFSLFIFAFNMRNTQSCASQTNEDCWFYGRNVTNE